MKIILKTIAGRLYKEEDVEPSTSVQDLMTQLEEEYDGATLKLVFNGSVLEAAKTLEEVGAKEGSTFVIAGKKKKIPKPETAPTADKPTEGVPEEPKKEETAPEADSLPESKKEDKPAEESKDTAPKDTTEASPQETTPAPPAAAAPQPAPAVATTGVDESLIDNIASMGFDDRAQIALALRAAYMNPERAVEYLCTGIPPSILREITAVPSAPTAPARAQAPSAPSGGGDLRASLLRTIPNFEDIRQVYKQNNSTLPTIMTQIAERYPDLYRQIEANPEAFLEIMSDDPPATTTATTAPAAAPANPEGGIIPTDQLSAEDNTAIDQLVELGGGMWDRDSAALVYLATRRNQEIAASVLFEHGGVPAELLLQLQQQQLGDFEEEEEEDQH
ncbi:UV excision repair protein RAD23 [Angomonas deanei]|uniref:UV excision repair protein RAD23 n=1 Tax=Angomonas deanei TaxID=59799 RepID=A0A7G2CFY3_9TRYP|nr:UV excision repair protein RAD23 [Angomonas deanei]CAD2217927.1 Ubiquitin family/UBA/TS-N domain/XPC-binding domain containing protein, putative [Angomonas deanei]|eukprot:EPY32962.1 UV excision repair protein RAD23 [Angomonas deanei]